jgi:hypothetical protein
MATMALTVLALLIPAPAPMEPAGDLSLQTTKAPGIEVRYVNYHWQPALFEAMEKGTGAMPEAKRNWVVARIVLEGNPVTVDGSQLRPANYALALWPSLDGKGMAVEIRRVDMRDVFENYNVMAPLPRGETVYKGAAKFETATPTAPRMSFTLDEAAGKVVLTLRYGDRRLALTLTR